MTSNKSLIERDLVVLWHPCTQMNDHEQLSLVADEIWAGIQNAVR
jgi:adenosylmethionine-8-amino-7-oxononanoate aminotransferase